MLYDMVNNMCGTFCNILYIFTVDTLILKICHLFLVKSIKYWLCKTLPVLQKKRTCRDA